MGNTKSGCKIPCSMTKVRKNIIMDENITLITSHEDILKTNFKDDENK